MMILYYDKGLQSFKHLREQRKGIKNELRKKKIGEKTRILSASS